jgi:DNA-binding NarL/FixJ family response regulator
LSDLGRPRKPKGGQRKDGKNWRKLAQTLDLCLDNWRDPSLQSGVHPLIYPRAKVLGSYRPSVAGLQEEEAPERGRVITVSIVDDDEGVRRSVAAFVNRSPGFKCVSSYPSGESAVEKLPRERPDVVLMDGIECAGRLKAAAPEIQIVILTDCEDVSQVFRALSAGATGYILKSSAPQKLLQAICDVHAGGSPMSNSIARQVVISFQKQSPPDGDTHRLTQREQSILECLARGLTYQQTADQLTISMGTLRTHIRRIYDKLGVHARTEAVAKYVGR